ncbi:hypothetical protein CC80DRAFT_598621 [Byssothecium circinans]|uniref:Uncharacterized protein n=1 Tax=Byssothecium circinans TaxID=147558 RepID=A0A6A5TDR1_9PLEO|nr:hypothetical protein CC80DRAFT_598621 [Byssothecium circinans]
MGSETIKRLQDLAKTGRASAEDLNSLNKHVAILQHGVHVSSLGQEAEETMASLMRLSSKALESITSHRILNSLAFGEMHTRYANVPSAYSETFQWMFEEHVPQKQQTALEGRMLFREWLEAGDEVFHISGKPGAGKSTLMKFLFRNPRTTDLLARWAAGRKLVFSKFFFWKPGSDMENSIPAMLRTLIYDTLQQCPELTSAVFPQHWSHIQSLPWQAPVAFRFDNHEIRAAFDRLIQIRNSGQKRCFCFFIDGLDEYQETPEERYKDLIQLLSSWTKAAARDLKLCVSSREHHVFLDHFNGPRGFRLQDLTYDDIYNFIHDKLERNETFMALEKPADGPHRLISKVADRADGVFMWVSLVVNLLDEACDDGDDFSELERRVEGTQPLVQDLFRQLLDSIHESDRDRSAQTFAVVLKCLENKYGMRMSLFRYSLLDDFNANPEFAADIDRLKSAGLVGMNNEHVQRREKRARKQLYRRCKGLLEVHTDAEDSLETIINPHGIIPYNSTLFKKTISLAHRDVYEFLLRDDVQKERNARLQGFDTFGVICQTFAAEVASTMVLKEEPSGRWECPMESSHWVPELMDILRGIPQHDPVREQDLRALDNLDVLRRPNGSGSEYCPELRVNVLSPEIAVPYLGDFSFSVCHFAAALGIVPYFRYEIQLTGRDTATKDGSLSVTLIWMLNLMLQGPQRGGIRLSAAETTNYPEILRRILGNGCCPNQAISRDHELSLWGHFISSSVGLTTLSTPMAEMAEVFLEFGADPDLSLTSRADKWDYYIDVSSSAPRRPTNIQPCFSFSYSPRVGRKPWEFVVHRGSATLRDTFEWLNPPNLQTLLALLGERKETEQKRVPTVSDTGSAPTTGTKTAATGPPESSANDSSMDVTTKDDNTSHLGAEGSGPTGPLRWMSFRSVISNPILTFALGILVAYLLWYVLSIGYP